MLVTRIISAFVGIIIGVLIITFSNTIVYPLFVAVLAVGMVHEILSNCTGMKYKFHSGLALIYAVVTPFLVEYTGTEIVLLFSVFCILAAFVLFVFEGVEMPFEKFTLIITAVLLITLSLCSFIKLKNADENFGKFYVYFTLFAAFFNDSGAFFVGCSLGKHKLCEKISPKKTIEGAVGGALVAVIVLIISSLIYKGFFAEGEVQINYLAIIIGGLISSGLGIIGDLSASIIKRQNDIKDFGKIMPGHGGFIDRFDSVLLIVPFWAIFLEYFPIFG